MAGWGGGIRQAGGPPRRVDNQHCARSLLPRADYAVPTSALCRTAEQCQDRQTAAVM